MKRFWVFCSVLAVFVMLGYWRYRQYPLPNPPAQRQRAQCEKFFATRPSLNRTLTFLDSQRIDYSKLPNTEIFDGNTATDFQLSHRREIGSEIVFRIYDVKKPYCGRIDAIFIVSFSKSGQLLKVENIDGSCCCLDF